MVQRYSGVVEAAPGQPGAAIKVKVDSETREGVITDYHPKDGYVWVSFWDGKMPVPVRLYKDRRRGRWTGGDGYHSEEFKNHLRRLERRY